jgi:hypothetical protein
VFVFVGCFLCFWLKQAKLKKTTQTTKTQNKPTTTKQHQNKPSPGTSGPEPLGPRPDFCFGWLRQTQLKTNNSAKPNKYTNKPTNY